MRAKQISHVLCAHGKLFQRQHGLSASAGSWKHTQHSPPSSSRFVGRFRNDDVEEFLEIVVLGKLVMFSTHPRCVFSFVVLPSLHPQRFSGYGVGHAIRTHAEY